MNDQVLKSILDMQANLQRQMDQVFEMIRNLSHTQTTRPNVSSDLMNFHNTSTTSSVTQNASSTPLAIQNTPAATVSAAIPLTYTPVSTSSVPTSLAVVPHSNAMTVLYSRATQQSTANSVASVVLTSTIDAAPQAHTIPFSTTASGQSFGATFVHNNSTIPNQPYVDTSMGFNNSGIPRSTYFGSNPGVTFDIPTSVAYQIPYSQPQFPQYFPARRRAPAPIVFDLNSTADFSVFLNNFERYCSIEYGNDTYEQWGNDLGKYLTGEIRDVYNVIGGGNTNYSELKHKLTSHVYDYSAKLQQRLIGQYNFISPNSSEPLHIFALRLQRLFETLYPTRDIDSELPTKFLTSIPRQEAREVEKELNLVRLVSLTTSVTWQGVLNLVKHRDSTILAHATPMAQATPTAQTTPPKRTHQGNAWFSSNSVHEKPTPHTTQAPNRPSPNSGAKPKKSYRVPKCTFCHKMGHDWDICRSRLRQCLVCGNTNHRTLECPNYNGSWLKNNPVATPRQPTQHSQPRPNAAPNSNAPRNNAPNSYASRNSNPATTPHVPAPTNSPALN